MAVTTERVGRGVAIDESTVCILNGDSEVVAGAGQAWRVSKSEDGAVSVRTVRNPASEHSTAKAEATADSDQLRR